MLLKRQTQPETALLDVAYDVLATYRLTTLVKDDKLTENLRGSVFRHFGGPEEGHKVSYLMTCPWCLGMYFAAFAVVGRRLWPSVWGPLAQALSLSALTGLLAEARARAQSRSQ